MSGLGLSPASPYAALMQSAVRMDGQLNDGEVPYLGMLLFKQISEESVLELVVTEVHGAEKSFVAMPVRCIDLSRRGEC